MAGSIKLNENLTFGKTGRIREMDPHGFDLSEPSISWTKDETAGLTVIPTAVPPDASLRMTVGATPFIHPGHANRQQFFVFINGRYIGFKTLAVAEKINFTLPRSLVSPRGMQIEFAIPTAASPMSLGISDDVRKLGIAISEISFGLQK